MRTVILLDRSFARREREMLARLEIGLADEGLRVLHAVPNAIIETEFVGVYSASVGYDDRGFPTTNRSRVRDLSAAIGRVIEAEAGSGGVDIVHSFGPGCEKLAVDLAASFGASALIEVWQTASFAAAADAFHRDPERVTLMVPDQRLMQSLTRAHKGCRVVEALWGVHASPAPEPSQGTVAPAAAPSIAFLAECVNPSLLDAALKGLADAVAGDASGGALSDLLIFVDADRVRSPRLWQAARKHGLLDRLSIVPRAESRREPILHLDALVVPEPTGRFRSIVLDAQARGVPIIAVPDPDISILSDPSIARLISPATPAAWCAALREILTDGPPRRSLSNAAREFVRTQRTASAHVAAVLKAYDAAATRRSVGPALGAGR